MQRLPYAALTLGERLTENHAVGSAVTVQDAEITNKKDKMFDLPVMVRAL